MEDHPRPWRLSPSTDDTQVQKVRDLVRANHRMTIREFAEKVKISIGLRWLFFSPLPTFQIWPRTIFYIAIHFKIETPKNWVRVAYKKNIRILLKKKLLITTISYIIILLLISPESNNHSNICRPAIFNYSIKCAYPTVPPFTKPSVGACMPHENETTPGFHEVSPSCDCIYLF